MANSTPYQPAIDSRPQPGSAARDEESLDLSTVNLSDRFDRWDEFLTNNISHHNRHPRHRETFIGSMAKKDVSVLRIITINASPYTSSVTDEILSSRTHRERLILVLPTASQFDINQDGFSASLTPGDMALLDSRLTGSLSGVDGSAHTLVSIGCKDWEARASAPVLEQNFKLDVNRLPARLARIFLNEILDAKDGVFNHEADVIARQLIELLSLIFETSQDSIPDNINKSVRLGRIKSFVRDKLGDPHLGPATVADQFNVSTRYISKMFSEANTTLMDYIWEARLQRAADLAGRQGGPRLTAKDISYRLGFSSPSHFSTKFSARFGVSPSEYRKALRNEGGRSTD